MKNKIPITIITGFLGSGKTSLINSIITDPSSKKPAIIVNEFGEIGLDHKLIQKSDDQLILLNNGCLCCLLQSDLNKTLQELLLKRNRDITYDFDSIIIETSGIADPAGIIQTLLADETIQSYFQFKKLITVIDATVNVNLMINQHDIFLQQILHADDICVSKIDKCNLKETPEHIIHALHKINSTANIYLSNSATLAQKVFSDELLINTPIALNRPHLALSHHQYHTYTVSYDQSINLDKLLKCLEAIIIVTNNNVLRIKGFVTIDGKENVYLINCVQNIMDEPHIHKGVRRINDPLCQLTFITSKIQSEFIQSACDYAWR